MFGNNIESTKAYRVTVPLFNDAGTSADGVRYFLPQIPEIDGKYITGIEAHLTGTGGDISPSVNAYGKSGIYPNNVRSSYIYLYLKDNNKAEKNGYIPLASLFNYAAAGRPKRVKPYYGKISTRDSFLTIPANSTGFLVTYFITLTFYYIQ